MRPDPDPPQRRAGPISLDCLFSDAMLIKPHRLKLSAWTGHIPFGASVVAMLRPQLLVELGTHAGNSYLAFCQAVVENHLPTKCYAVDTWVGDEHSLNYDESIFDDLSRYHQQRYADFSRLMRTTFDDAATYFADGTVDLLHIDGLHTHEAVQHDFQTWLPKMSGRGVILFHDINVRERGFGVWKMWEEVRARYPHLEFAHSHGLGVLFVGAEIAQEGSKLAADWSGDRGQTAKGLFAQLGQAVEQQYALLALAEKRAEPTYNPSKQGIVTVDELLLGNLFANDRIVAYYRAEGAGYSEESSCNVLWLPNQSTMSVQFQIPVQAGPFYLRIDPSEHAGWFGIASILLDGESIDAHQRLTACNGAILDPASSEGVSFIAIDKDPFIELQIGPRGPAHSAAPIDLAFKVVKRGVLASLQSIAGSAVTAAEAVSSLAVTSSQRHDLLNKRLEEGHLAVIGELGWVAAGVRSAEESAARRDQVNSESLAHAVHALDELQRTMRTMEASLGSLLGDRLAALESDWNSAKLVSQARDTRTSARLAILEGHLESMSASQIELMDALRHRLTGSESASGIADDATNKKTRVSLRRPS